MLGRKKINVTDAESKSRDQYMLVQAGIGFYSLRN